MTNNVEHKPTSKSQAGVANKIATPSSDERNNPCVKVTSVFSD